MSKFANLSCLLLCLLVWVHSGSGASVTRLATFGLPSSVGTPQKAPCMQEECQKGYFGWHWNLMAVIIASSLLITVAWRAKINLTRLNTSTALNREPADLSATLELTLDDASWTPDTARKSITEHLSAGAIFASGTAAVSDAESQEAADPAGLPGLSSSRTFMSACLYLALHAADRSGEPAPQPALHDTDSHDTVLEICDEHSSAQHENSPISKPSPDTTALASARDSDDLADSDCKDNDANGPDDFHVRSAPLGDGTLAAGCCPVCQGPGRNLLDRHCQHCYTALWKDARRVVLVAEERAIKCWLVGDQTADLIRFSQEVENVGKRCISGTYNCPSELYHYSASRADRCTRCRSRACIRLLPDLALRQLQIAFNVGGKSNVSKLQGPPAKRKRITAGPPTPVRAGPSASKDVLPETGSSTRRSLDSNVLPTSDPIEAPSRRNEQPRNSTDPVANISASASAPQVGQDTQHMMQHVPSGFATGMFPGGLLGLGPQYWMGMEGGGFPYLPSMVDAQAHMMRMYRGPGPQCRSDVSGRNGVFGPGVGSWMFPTSFMSPMSPFSGVPQTGFAMPWSGAAREPPPGSSRDNEFAHDKPA